MLRQLAILLLLAHCSCRGDVVPGKGPTVTASSAAVRERFLHAIVVAGNAYEARGWANTAALTDLELVEGWSFSDGGRDLWGRNRLALTGAGVRCEIDLATKLIPIDVVLPSELATAHEIGHHARGFALGDSDHDHTDRVFWGSPSSEGGSLEGGTVGEVQDVLKAEGL